MMNNKEEIYMAQSKKRPKYIEDIIRDANAQFRRNYVKDENDSLFSWLCGYLLDKDMYQGYNYHKWGDKIVNPETGERNVILAGSYKKDEYDFLQVW